MIGGTLQWGLNGVGASYPGDSIKTAEARRSDSGEACGKHGTQRQSKALMVRRVVTQSVQGVLKQC